MEIKSSDEVAKNGVGWQRLWCKLEHAHQAMRRFEIVLKISKELLIKFFTEE